MAGRPTDYNLEVAEKICEMIASGCSFRTIAKDEAMPAMSSMFKWLRLHPEFTEQYTKAKEQQADALAEEVLDIADDGINDWMEIHDPNNPGWKINGESIQRSKVRIDTRKWLAGKLRPKKYGDSVNQKITDGDGKPLKAIDATATILSMMSVEQLEAALAVVSKE